MAIIRGLARLGLVGTVLACVLDAGAGFAIIPRASLAPSSSSKAQTGACTRSCNTRATTSLRMDIDQNTLIGIATGVGGLALGIGLVAFTEAQGERTVARGDLGERMASKLAAGLMEDEEDYDTDVDDVTTKMRRALESGGTEEQRQALKDRKVTAAIEKEDDGW